MPITLDGTTGTTTPTVKLNSSGGGSMTLSVPSTASTLTQVVPAVSGTLVTSGDTATVTSAMLATAVKPLGVGQTWQDVAASRALSTDYTNSTGRPIMVSVSCQGSGTASRGSITAVVGGVTIASAIVSESSGVWNQMVEQICFIVPDATVYRVNGTVAMISYWAELR